MKSILQKTERSTEGLEIRTTVRGRVSRAWWSIVAVLVMTAAAQAGEADLAIPDLHEGKFHILGRDISAWNILFWGAVIIAITLSISLYLRSQIRKLPAHKSMLDVADVIYRTSLKIQIYRKGVGSLFFCFFFCVLSFFCLGLGLGGGRVGGLGCLFFVGWGGGGLAGCGLAGTAQTYPPSGSAFALRRGVPWVLISFVGGGFLLTSLSRPNSQS